jgi:hypothetical protein
MLLFVLVYLVSAFHSSNFGSVCYGLAYAMGQQYRYSPVKNILHGGDLFTVAHAHCSYYAYNVKMLF